MRMLLAATAALALAACGGSEPATTDTMGNDLTSVDNTMMTTDDGMMNDMSNGMATAGMGGGTVTVTISGVRANGGPVLVALQNEGQFAQKAAAYSTTVQPTGTSVTATFEGVTPGSYAAAAVQDTNSDGDFTIGNTGPTEPFGFSGTPQTTGAPTYGPATFQATEAGGTATVTLAGGAQ